MFDDKCFSTITYITIYYMAHASLLLLFTARIKKRCGLFVFHLAYAQLFVSIAIRLSSENER